MADKGDTTKKQSQQQLQIQPASQTHKQQQQQPSQQSPQDNLEESTEARPIHHKHSPNVVVSGASHFISGASLYVPSGGATSTQYEHQFEAINPKRPRFSTSTGQWKLLSSPPSQQKPAQMSILPTESSPQSQPQQLLTIGAATASSSDTASSPSHSPMPSLSASGQEGNKPETEQAHPQFRKGKYVSPVWKPNEMLWLARAWKVQYQGGSNGSRTEHVESGQSRGKTRADKDREVAEFLQKHGINRDAKTAGTKWDNMLGEFRKVYEWERGGEREQVGKSYFRLSPYERKIHRLPASFDEEVFEELSQFMGSRIRSSTSHSRAASPLVLGDETGTPLASSRSLPPPPPFKEDELPLSARTKQGSLTSGGGDPFCSASRGLVLGFDPTFEIAGASSSTSSKELRRIGKIRMTWEETVSIWGEEGEVHRGRVRLEGSTFLNADELSFFDDSRVPCRMESFEEGSLKGFSVERFVSGQQVKVFGRRKSSSASPSSGFVERLQFPSIEPSIRSIPPLEFQDPTESYVGCLRVSPPTLPGVFELSWHLQEPPPQEFKFPLRRDVYRDLPQGKELFFTISNEPLDCRAIVHDIISPIIRANACLTTTTRESFIGLWDDCINRVVSKFCSSEMVFIRKPTSQSAETLQDQWPNMTGYVRNYCLWRGEETDQLREGQLDPSSSLVEKLLWTYLDLPYILGYYAVGYLVTFCALSRSQDRIARTDLYTLDLSSPSERLKGVVACYRIGGLLTCLAERCYSNITSSDFERVDLGNGNVVEMTPNTCTRFFSSKRKWGAVKEIYDFLDHRIPHAEYIFRLSEKELGLVFKPRGCKIKPTSCEQLVEALKYVTKALVALHDLSFMHRDLSWDKVMRRNDRENEWFVCGFDLAVSAPQIYPHLTGSGGEAEARGRRAPEMGRGLHGVKVDVWGVGYLIKTCGLSGVPKMLRELQNRCLEQNPEQRPTAADCYHHLLQLQSSLSAAVGGPVVM